MTRVFDLIYIFRKDSPTGNVRLEHEKPSRESSISSVHKTTPNKGESSSNPVRINIHDRLQEFYSQLRALPKARTAKEALKQVIHTLDKVEDELSGIQKKTPHLHQVNQTEECIHHKRII